MGALRAVRNYGLRGGNSSCDRPRMRGRAGPVAEAALDLRGGSAPALGESLATGRVKSPPFEGAIATMLVFKRSAALAIMVCAVLAGGRAALAALGQPSPWQVGMQQSASPVMDNIVWFHDFLLYIITAITRFALALLIIVMVRFNARGHPIPSRTTHNTLLEVAWTNIPIVI